MENLTYIGLSRQISLWKQMNATANNMANMNTTGYKAQKVTFNEYLNRTNVGDSVYQISQVEGSLDFNDLRQGPLQKTDNPLDVAINGDGYFAIETPAGVRYSRAGSFQINNNNELITTAGYKVLDEGGAPIVLPENAVNISISQNGSINTENGEVGSIKIVKFADDTLVMPIGDNLFHTNNAREEIVENPVLQQGMIEMSNVEPILEMNNMIKLQRMFEATQNMLSSDHDRQRNAIKILSEV